MIELSVRTPSRRAAVDITRDIEDVVHNSGVSEGICVVYVPHTTAGITINEHADPSVIHDIMNALVKLTAGMEWTHLEGELRCPLFMLSSRFIDNCAYSPRQTFIRNLAGHLLYGV